jgi:DNA repair protein SbcD/Mre11
MTKILYFGDPHIRGTRPRNRLDDYKEALKAKFREVFALAKYKGVDAIIQPGDTFHTPEVSTGVLLEFAELLEESPVPIYTTAGNHDIYGYNLDTYNRTSLKVLEKLVPQLTVINAPDKPVRLGTSPQVQITFTPYSGEMDKDGYGYSPEGLAATWNGLKIHVAHGMLLDHEPPFDKFTLVQNVETAADLILTGHDHIGYGIYERRDGKTFCNPGSLSRMDASQSELERKIQVLLIDVPAEGKPQLELLPLQSAKPGHEVLDRSSIEAENKRAYAMEQFAALIQSENGDKVLVDIESIVKAVAETENINPAVVKKALEKIAAAREEVRG